MGGMTLIRAALCRMTVAGSAIATACLVLAWLLYMW